MSTVKTEATVKKRKVVFNSNVDENADRSKFFINLEKKIIKDFQEIDDEDYIIRFEGLNKTGRKDKTVKEFLKRFFLEFNPTKTTIFAVSKQEYCTIRKRRSIGDIFMLTRYYYPKVKIEEIYKILLTEFNTEINSFRGSFCYATRKFMFYVGRQSDVNRFYNLSDPNEYGVTINDILKNL